MKRDSFSQASPSQCSSCAVAIGARTSRRYARLGEKAGGEYVDEIHFTYPGGQIHSMLSLTSYLGSGQYRDRYLGLRIPPTNVQPEHLEQTRAFASALADRLFGKGRVVPDREEV